jgi:hypothetical protein
MSDDLVAQARALMARRDVASHYGGGVPLRLLRELADLVPGLVADLEFERARCVRALKLADGYASELTRHRDGAGWGRGDDTRKP